MVASVSDQQIISEHRSNKPAVAYMYEALGGTLDDRRTLEQPSSLFVFQYWPSEMSDDYQANWNEMNIPMSSHPLYQWTGGSGRTLTFTAHFTSEVNDQEGGRSLGIESSKYTVDVSAALARLRQYLLPRYRIGGQLGVVEAPRPLILVFPNSKMGSQSGAGSDEMLVILRSAPAQITHWFPDGTPRIAQVEMTFNEIVQKPVSGERSQIQYTSRDDLDGIARRYQTSNNLSVPFGARSTG